MAIWHDLVDDHGFPAGYASVRRFVSTVRQQPAVEARAVITTDRGEEAQVGYGEGPMVRYGRRTVHLDGCVEVASAYYSAPPGWIGRRVDVQWDDIHVRLLDPGTGQLQREHLRTRRGWHRIAADDRPARTPPKTLALLAAAKRTGPAISAVCDHIHRHEGAAGVRRIFGVLSLARKHECGSTGLHDGRKRPRGTDRSSDANCAPGFTGPHGEM